MNKLPRTWQSYFWFSFFAVASIGSCVGGGMKADEGRWGLGLSLWLIASVLLAFMFGVALSTEDK